MVQHDYLRGEFLHGFGSRLRVARHVSALYVPFADASYVEADVVAGKCLVNLFVVHFYAFYFTLCARWHKDKLVVYFHRSGFYAADRHSAYARYAVHVLYREAKRLSCGLFRHLEKIKRLHKCWSFVPACLVGLLGDIVTNVAGCRNELHVVSLESNSLQKFYHCLFRLCVLLLVIADRGNDKT